MSAANACVVEFVGGPLDGHEQFVSLDPRDLNDVVLLPVGTVLALLYKSRAHRALRSLAVYELGAQHASRPSYQYVGSVGSG